jgi:hypothetical protein
MHPDRTARRLLFVFIAVALTLAVPSMTEAKSLWHLRVFGVWIEPDLDYKVPADDDTDLLATADGGFGLGISAEYQFSDRLGLELGILRASPDIVLDYYLREFDASFSVSDSLAMTPITLGLDIHLLPESRLDLYLSPFLGYVRNSDLEFTINQSFEVGGQIITIEDAARVQVASDVAYGATLGVDIPFSSRPWAVATSLRYLATELNATDPDGESITPDFNSWILTVGLRYTF